MEKNNPFDTMSITDIEQRAKVERAKEMGRLYGLLFSCVGSMFHNVGRFHTIVRKSNCIAANSNYYINNPEKLKNKFL